MTEDRHQQLVAYYDVEVEARAQRALDPLRVEQRDGFLALLRQEQRRTVVEVGCGPGIDGLFFTESSYAWTGVDLAAKSVEHCQDAGLRAYVASATELPLADQAYDAGWTMNTLLHLTDVEARLALSELGRVLVPGAPLAIGLWARQETADEHWDDGKGYGPPRFFRFRSDSDVVALLAEVGTVEQWMTWNGEAGLHYQWAIVRRSPEAIIADAQKNTDN